MCVCVDVYVCVCVCVRYFLAFVYICVLGSVYLYACVCALRHVCVSEGIDIPLCMCVYRSGDSLECGAHLPPSLRQGLVLLATAHAAALQASRDAGVCLHCHRRNAGMTDVCFPVSALSWGPDSSPHLWQSTASSHLPTLSGDFVWLFCALS